MNRTGIIGGSALCEIEGLEVIEREWVPTPFGNPSDEFVIGRFEGKEVVFLPRHGRAHNMLPSELNYCANIYGFKILGVDRIISVSAVGSLKEEIKPLEVVLVDQFIDRTNQARKSTFFGEGIVAHVPFAEPVCSELRELIYECNRGLDQKVHDGGTYVNMEGPAFSTKAESYLYKGWGMDVIGMTNMPEARLAREAGICYASVAMVTDYDCWYLGADVKTVSVEMVLQNVKRNMGTAKTILSNTLSNLSDKKACKCSRALENAIITDVDNIPPETIGRLRPIIEDYIK